MRTLVALLLLILAGCSSAPKSNTMIEPEQSVPGDFWLELVVPIESTAPGRDHADMVRRFVVLPDLTLRCREQEQSSGPGGLPPVTRTLSLQQMHELWELARPLVWSKQSMPIERGFGGGQTGSASRLMICAQRRILMIMPQDADAQSRSAYDALARRLDVLAFSPGSATTAAAVAPRRYDFGPDPYARYRR